METINKEIRLVTDKPGVGKNGKPYMRFEFEFTDGFKVSTFDEKIGKAFKPGQVVAITGEKEGAFWTMKDMVLTSGNITPKAEVISNSSQNASREATIIAQCLVKAYCSSAPVDMTKESVLEAYRWFLGELNGKQ